MKTDSRELTLHVGTHKTGTTALQNFLSTNERILRKNGVLYPPCGRAAMGAHHHFVASVRLTGHPMFQAEKSFEEYLEDLKSVSRQCSRVLLSSEMFSENVDREKLRQLHSVFSTIRIVLYLRRQDSYLESSYAQLVKTGKIGHEIDVHILQDRKLDYLTRCRFWEDLAGKGNVLVRPYEKGQLHQENLFADFLHHVFGLELTDDYKLPKRELNTRLSREALEYQKLVNRLKPRRAGQRPLLAQLSGYSLRSSPETVRAFSGHGLLSPAQRSAILQPYAAGNERVAVEFLGRPDCRLFQDPLPDADAPWMAYPGLSQEEIKAISLYLASSARKTAAELAEIIREGLGSSEAAVREAAELLAGGLEELSGKSHDLRGGVYKTLKRVYSSLPSGIRNSGFVQGLKRRFNHGL